MYKYAHVVRGAVLVRVLVPVPVLCLCRLYLYRYAYVLLHVFLPSSAMHTYLSKVDGEGVAGGGPALQLRQRVLPPHFHRLRVQPEERVARHALPNTSVVEYNHIR